MRRLVTKLQPHESEESKYPAIGNPLHLPSRKKQPAGAPVVGSGSSGAPKANIQGPVISLGSIIYENVLGGCV